MKLDMILNGYKTSDMGFNLNPSFSIGSPVPKVYEIDVPYANGKLDISESVTNGVVFNNRTITFTLEKLRPKNAWFSSYSDFISRFVGQKVKLSVPYDEKHHFVGRVSASEMNRSNQLSFEVSVDCDPYRYKNEKTVVVESISSVPTVVKLENESMLSIPVIQSTHPATIRFKNSQWSINEGETTLPIILESGINEVTVTGPTEITFVYQEGRL